MRCAVRVGGTAMVVVVMLWDLTRLLVMSARRLAGVDGLQGHVPAPVGSHGLVIIPVLVVAGRGRARRRGRRASLSLRESLEEKVVVERVRHRGRRRGRRRRLRCMARRHRRVESLEEGAVDLLDLERHLNRPAQPPRQPDDGVVLWGAQLLKLVGKIQQRSSQELPSNLGQILHMEPVIHLRNVFVIRISYSAVDKNFARPLLSSPFSCSGIILEHRFPRSNRLDLAQTRAPAFTARERHRTRAHARGSGSTFTRHSLRLSVSRAIRRAEPAFRLTGGHIPAKGREMKPVSVTPTLAPREADDTAICARASCAGPSEYGHRSAASPPAARDGRGRLRRDGPGAGSGSCSGRSSSWRLHLHWTRASLVVLALLALVVAPGTIFAVAAAPDSDLVPVRGFRRLTQTTNDGGVEYLQRAKLTAGTDGAADDEFGYSVSIDGDTMVIGASGMTVHIPRTCSRATRPATSPPAGRRLRS